MNVNTAVYDKIIDRAALIRLYEKRLSDKVFVVLDNHTIRVDKLVKEAKASENGFRRLRNAVDADITKTYKEAYTISKTSLLDFVVDQVAYTYQNIENAMSKLWRTQRPERRVAEEFVLERPLIGDKTLALGWSGIANGEKARIEQIIRKGIAEGKTPNDIAFDVTKATKISRNQSGALVTTAVTSVHAQADHAVYKANEKALYGWQYVAVLDSRTTPICRHRDGQIYTIGQTQYLPPAHIRCYLEGTEVLTKDGFKDFRDVDLNDLCLSLDPITEDLSWQPVVRIFKKTGQDVINIDSKTVSMSVSVDHPFIGQKRVDRGDYKEYVFKKYESIFDIQNLGDFRLFASSKWKGAALSAIKINDFEISTETYCKFMAWYLSDGSVAEKHKGYIDSKITQETHLKFMYENLSELNPTLRNGAIGFTNQHLGRYLLQFGKCDEKFIPEELKNLDKESILLFLNSYLLADGCQSKGTDFEGYISENVRSFFTTSYKLASDLVECIIKVGDSASISEQIPRSYIDINGKEYNTKKVTYRIYWNRSQYRRLFDCDITFDENKTVYDVELADKHTLLIKYNGKIIWGSNCRSTTVPVFKSWADVAALEGVTQVRRRNISKLSKEDLAFYDGQTPMRETYDQWLRRQPQEVKLRHLGDYTKVNLFDAGQISLDKFDTLDGKSAGLRELRQMTQATIPGDTARFAAAKQRLDAMQLGASTPDDFIGDQKLTNTLKDYYLLQAGELDGTLSLTNYRGILIGNKRAQKNRVLNNLPTEEQLVFNPVTNRYEDIRLYQPSPSILQNNLRLIRESDVLKDQDKLFLENFINSLEDKMGVNERAVVLDNLRILFTRYRKNPEVWQNFKAVSQAQIKFDVTNFSDTIETQLRFDADIIKKLKQNNYIDPVLGPIQLDDLYDTFIETIQEKNKWEDRYAPRLARRLRGIYNLNTLGLPKRVLLRLSDAQLQQFYLKFAHRLSLADGPDFDSFATALGRDLYNLANLNGTKNDWYNAGKVILEHPSAKSLYELETFGVQKRRMKSRMSGQYFGPYYDTFSRNIRITDPKILEYAKMTRKIDVGIRLGVKDKNNKLIIRPGYKTYFIDKGILGYEDTRIPIISTSSYSDFPAEFVDKDLADALNWMANTRYKIDTDFYDFIDNLLFFKDDKGKAEYFDSLNEYRKYIVSRGDSYERFKAMGWLRKTDSAFSNHVFIDHRARVYERGLIGVQSGETSTAS